MRSAQEIIQQLKLQPHPEKGYFIQVRSSTIPEIIFDHGADFRRS